MRSFLVSVLLVGCYMACVSCKPWESKVGKSTEFKVCGEESAKYLATVTEVDVVPCSADPCVLVRGQNSTISIKFKVNDGVQAINQTKSVVHGIVAGIPVPFPLDNDNGCKDCGLTCPLKAGSSYTYSFSLPIPKDIPSLECVVKWELQNAAPSKKNSNADDVFCVEMPVYVK